MERSLNTVEIKKFPEFPRRGKKRPRKQKDPDEDDESLSESQPTDDQMSKVAQEKSRENARNTRLRKKVYIEKLKQTVAQLGAEREILETERKMNAARLEEQQKVRIQVIQTMFFYRATGEFDRDKWSNILDDSCLFMHPITPYRSFHAGEVVNNHRHIKGIDAIIADCASFRVLLDSVAAPNSSGEVRATYYFGPEDTVVVGDSVMCRWMMRTDNAVQCGSLSELYNHGMLKADFSSQNLIIKLDMMFDVMSYMQQIQRCSGKPCFHIVPNTVALAKQSTDEPRMIVQADQPFLTMFVNRAWSKMFGYSMEEMFMKSVEIIDGAQGQSSIVYNASVQFPLKRAFAFATKANSRYRKMFPIHICFYPLTKDGALSHYLLVFHEMT